MTEFKERRPPNATNNNNNGRMPETTKKIRSAIKAKLDELGANFDDELPDYVVIMIANRKTRGEMAKSLKGFLGKGIADEFAKWLHRVLEILQSLSGGADAINKFKPTITTAESFTAAPSASAPTSTSTFAPSNSAADKQKKTKQKEEQDSRQSSKKKDERKSVAEKDSEQIGKKSCSKSAALSENNQYSSSKKSSSDLTKSAPDLTKSSFNESGGDQVCDLSRQNNDDNNSNKQPPSSVVDAELSFSCFSAQPETMTVKPSAIESKTHPTITSESSRGLHCPTTTTEERLVKPQIHAAPPGGTDMDMLAPIRQTPPGAADMADMLPPPISQTLPQVRLDPLSKSIQRTVHVASAAMGMNKPSMLGCNPSTSKDYKTTTTRKDDRLILEAGEAPGPPGRNNNHDEKSLSSSSNKIHKAPHERMIHSALKLKPESRRNRHREEKEKRIDDKKNESCDERNQSTAERSSFSRKSSSRGKASRSKSPPTTTVKRGSDPSTWQHPMTRTQRLIAESARIRGVPINDPPPIRTEEVKMEINQLMELVQTKQLARLEADREPGQVISVPLPAAGVGKFRFGSHLESTTAADAVDKAGRGLRISTASSLSRKKQTSPLPSRKKQTSPLPSRKKQTSPFPTVLNKLSPIRSNKDSSFSVSNSRRDRRRNSLSSAATTRRKSGSKERERESSYRHHEVDSRPSSSSSSLSRKDRGHQVVDHHRSHQEDHLPMDNDRSSRKANSYGFVGPPLTGANSTFCVPLRVPPTLTTAAAAHHGHRLMPPTRSPQRSRSPKPERPDRSAAHEELAVRRSSVNRASTNCDLESNNNNNNKKPVIIKSTVKITRTDSSSIASLGEEDDTETLNLKEKKKSSAAAAAAVKIKEKKKKSSSSSKSSTKKREGGKVKKKVKKTAAAADDDGKKKKTSKKKSKSSDNKSGVKTAVGGDDIVEGNEDQQNSASPAMIDEGAAVAVEEGEIVSPVKKASSGGAAADDKRRIITITQDVDDSNKQLPPYLGDKLILGEKLGNRLGRKIDQTTTNPKEQGGTRVTKSTNVKQGTINKKGEGNSNAIKNNPMPSFVKPSPLLKKVGTSKTGSEENRRKPPTVIISEPLIVGGGGSAAGEQQATASSSTTVSSGPKISINFGGLTNSNCEFLKRLEGKELKFADEIDDETESSSDRRAASTSLRAATESRLNNDGEGQQTAQDNNEKEDIVGMFEPGTTDLTMNSSMMKFDLNNLPPITKTITDDNNDSSPATSSNPTSNNDNKQEVVTAAEDGAEGLLGFDISDELVLGTLFSTGGKSSNPNEDHARADMDEKFCSSASNAARGPSNDTENIDNSDHQQRQQCHQPRFKVTFAGVEGVEDGVRERVHFVAHEQEIEAAFQEEMLELDYDEEGLGEDDEAEDGMDDQFEEEEIEEEGPDNDEEEGESDAVSVEDGELNNNDSNCVVGESDKEDPAAVFQPASVDGNQESTTLSSTLMPEVDELGDKDGENAKGDEANQAFDDGQAVPTQCSPPLPNVDGEAIAEEKEEEEEDKHSFSLELGEEEVEKEEFGQEDGAVDEREAVEEGNSCRTESADLAVSESGLSHSTLLDLERAGPQHHHHGDGESVSSSTGGGTGGALALKSKKKKVMRVAPFRPNANNANAADTDDNQLPVRSTPTPSLASSEWSTQTYLSNIVVQEQQSQNHQKPVAPITDKLPAEEGVHDEAEPSTSAIVDRQGAGEKKPLKKKKKRRKSASASPHRPRSSSTKKTSSINHPRTSSSSRRKDSIDDRNRKTSAHHPRSRSKDLHEKKKKELLSSAYRKRKREPSEDRNNKANSRNADSSKPSSSLSSIPSNHCGKKKYKELATGKSKEKSSSSSTKHSKTSTASKNSSKKRRKTSPFDEERRNESGHSMDSNDDDGEKTGSSTNHLKAVDDILGVASSSASSALPTVDPIYSSTLEQVSGNMRDRILKRMKRKRGVEEIDEVSINEPDTKATAKKRSLAGIDLSSCAAAALSTACIGGAQAVASTALTKQMKITIVQKVKPAKVKAAAEKGAAVTKKSKTVVKTSKSSNSGSSTLIQQKQVFPTPSSSTSHPVQQQFMTDQKRKEMSDELERINAALALQEPTMERRSMSQPDQLMKDCELTTEILSRQPKQPQLAIDLNDDSSSDEDNSDDDAEETDIDDTDADMQKTGRPEDRYSTNSISQENEICPAGTACSDPKCRRVHNRPPPYIQADSSRNAAAVAASAGNRLGPIVDNNMSNSNNNNLNINQQMAVVVSKTPCSTFPYCRFGDRCKFSHPLCKFDLRCTRANCSYSHSNKKSSAQVQIGDAGTGGLGVSGVNNNAVMTRNGSNNANHHQPYFSGLPIRCKSGRDCMTSGCPFIHPTPPACLYGTSCTRRNCTYSHPNMDVMNNAAVISQLTDNNAPPLPFIQTTAKR